MKGIGSQPLAGEPIGQAQSWQPFRSVLKIDNKNSQNSFLNLLNVVGYFVKNYLKRLNQWESRRERNIFCWFIF